MGRSWKWSVPERIHVPASVGAFLARGGAFILPGDAARHTCNAGAGPAKVSTLFGAEKRKPLATSAP
jgi:hypothetical protein